MSLLAALFAYSLLIAGGWYLGTGGLLAALILIVVIERRLARYRTILSIRSRRGEPSAHR